MDLGCPHCAASWQRIDALELRLAFRHFPVASKHPRAPALHAAAEAAGLQDEERFWEMCDSIYHDQGHIDDPHLWQRVETLGLELERFERDRRSDPVAERVKRDFDAGIRAGVIGTPAAVADGRLILRDVAAELASLKAPG
jgi:protein-disulfide isomerase